MAAAIKAETDRTTQTASVAQMVEEEAVKLQWLYRIRRH